MNDSPVFVPTPESVRHRAKVAQMEFWVRVLVVIAVGLACLVIGWSARGMVEDHRCPQEDSCGYVHHKWRPVEH